MVGTLSGELLHAVLDAIPVEITVIDGDDRIVSWNRHESRVFKRSEEIVGRDIRDCHSEKSMDTLERMLAGMKQGDLDSATFWYDESIVEGEPPHKILIEYRALRNAGGKYIGCLAATQDIEKMRTLDGEKRDLD
ncbi:MAG: PAS domain-containing protein [bacterium]|nr:MAG: PAS domain-containing protein [bacterium]